MPAMCLHMLASIAPTSKENGKKKPWHIIQEQEEIRKQNKNTEEILINGVPLSLVSINDVSKNFKLSYRKKGWNDKTISVVTEMKTRDEIQNIDQKLFIKKRENVFKDSVEKYFPKQKIPESVVVQKKIKHFELKIWKVVYSLEY